MDFVTTKALTFDCYGTLIDWESGILAVLRPWADRQSLSASDDQLLETFGQAETEVQRDHPSDLYPAILRATMQGVARRLNSSSTPDDANRLAVSVGDWPTFPDTVAALERLKRHFRLMVVSNIDRGSFARSAARLEVPFDALVTAEDVGAYKPDHRMFDRAFAVLADMDIERGQIVHVAQSLYHDHVPAKALGLQTVWVDRRQGRGGGATHPPGKAITPDLTVRSLAELVDIVEAS